MSSRKEMVPAGSPGLCGPEWKLLCWIRRELGLIKLKTPKATILSDIARILVQMNESFNDWPEDPK